MTQATVVAQERSDEKRFQYQYDIAPYDPEMLVFCDESATNKFTTRRDYAWAPVGECARRRDFFIRGVRSVLALIHV
jgi:hypothetical protein